MFSRAVLSHYFPYSNLLYSNSLRSICLIWSGDDLASVILHFVSNCGMLLFYELILFKKLKKKKKKITCFTWDGVCVKKMVTTRLMIVKEQKQKDLLESRNCSLKF
jgi:hypothetical protein